MAMRYTSGQRLHPVLLPASAGCLEARRDQDVQQLVAEHLAEAESKKVSGESTPSLKASQASRLIL